MNRIKSSIIRRFIPIKSPQKPKIFCIGFNKTGTTSMAKLFDNIGYQVASQRAGEALVKDWLIDESKNIVKYVKNGGEVFQDIPFSLPDTYKVLDKNFPDSKFILTIRDSPEVWYDSLIRFHAKMFNNGKIIEKDEYYKYSKS